MVDTSQNDRVQDGRHLMNGDYVAEADTAAVRVMARMAMAVCLDGLDLMPRPRQFDMRFLSHVREQSV